MNTKITCSNCGATNELAIENVSLPRGPGGERYSPSAYARDVVGEFLDQAEPGDYPSRVLYAAFCDWLQATHENRKPPAIQTFAPLVVSLAGAVTYRTSKGRFVSLPQKAT